MVETGQHNSTAKWMVILLVTALLVAGVTFGVTALLVDIFDKTAGGAKSLLPRGGPR